ncbi:MAG: UTP--glucose-1-phosphate uridylyltransferase [Halobacteriovoraceae bacterium]|jgi:UTP--glucose-1-phosphate uridylyltransferase|nr:UTP--glucose-1-phosphate uridylyltransferase [Halobacteriovoraceae bacterium]MBT5096014.1 UTP--glucose-1-phosphate uridylyltransferase [Halobacteriovoraceae bacterium]
MKINKAVIPVAGKGTRFLPASKEVPKLMIPLVDRPMIHYAVEEAVKSGITEIIFVTSSSEPSLEEKYFSRNSVLENFLQKNGKEKELKLVKEIAEMVKISSVVQEEPLGLGHAILCAEKLVGDESFAVVLGDDLIIGDNPVTSQLMEVYDQNDQASVIGVMEVPNSDTAKYGIVDGEFCAGSKNTLLMKTMVEKPAPSDAPTNLATPGRYILSPKIFDCLKRIERGVGGEYQLTDAINMLAAEDRVFAHIFSGERFDTGNILNYLEATVEFALANPATREAMVDIIRNKSAKYSL